MFVRHRKQLYAAGLLAVGNRDRLDAGIFGMRVDLAWLHMSLTTTRGDVAPNKKSRGRILYTIASGLVPLRNSPTLTARLEALHSLIS